LKRVEFNEQATLPRIHKTKQQLILEDSIKWEERKKAARPQQNKSRASSKSANSKSSKPSENKSRSTSGNKERTSAHRSRATRKSGRTVPEPFELSFQAKGQKKLPPSAISSTKELFYGKFNFQPDVSESSLYDGKYINRKSQNGSRRVDTGHSKFESDFDEKYY